MNVKNVFLVLLGASIGSICTVTMLYHQYNNQYTLGVNAGEILGKRRVISFLKENINNNPDISKTL